jgi:chromosome segregation ATPase
MFRTGGSTATTGEGESISRLSNDLSDSVSGGSIVSRRQASAQVVERLEKGYSRLTSLVDSIERHMEAQNEGTRQVVDAMGRLVNTVSELPETLKNQQRELASISEQLEAVGQMSARWESAADDLPRLADAQRDTLEAVRGHIDANRQGQERVSESMDAFRDAVGSLGDASTSSISVLKDLQRATASRDDSLCELIRDQNKKFTTLFIVAIVVAVVMAAGTLTALFVK